MQPVALEFTIRPLAQDDIPAFTASFGASRPALATAFAWASTMNDATQCAQWVVSHVQGWAQHLDFTFALTHAASHAFVGAAGIHRVDWSNMVGELDVWTDSRWLGRGAATAGAEQAARFAFINLGLRRLELLVAEDNVAGLRVAEKLGARREGIARKRLRLGGVSRDAALLSLLARDIKEEPVLRRPMEGPLGTA